MNVVCLLGRLTATPELKTTQSGVSVTSFSVAVDRTYQPKGAERQTDFINCVAWRNTADFICRYFQKGQRIALQGSLQSRSYTDKTGASRTVFEVVIDNAFFAESKGNSAPRSDSQPMPSYTEAAPAFSTAGGNDFEEIVGDDDLPF